MATPKHPASNALVRLSGKIGGYTFGTVAFVRHPHVKGLWVKTHVCVLERACPSCSAVIGEPCRQKSGYLNLYTHTKRRRFM